MKRFVRAALLATAMTPAAAFADGPDPSQIVVEGLFYNGSGCAAGTVAANLSPDRQAVTLLFDSFDVATDAIRTKICTLNFRMRVPPRWSFALFSVDSRGYASATTNASGYHNLMYRLGGSPLRTLGTIELKGEYNGDYVRHAEIPVQSTQWSSCLSTIQNVGITIQTGVRSGPGGTAMMTVDSLDSELRHQIGLKWKHCP